MADPDAWAPARTGIPEGATPKDLIPGDPDKIDDLVVDLRAYAAAFKDGHDKLGPLKLYRWSGKGATAFRDAVDRLPKELASAHTQFTNAVSALSAYASKLRGIQERCKPIIADAAEARSTAKNHDRKIKDYNDAVKRGDDALPERPAETNPGITAMENCQRRLDGLIFELQFVVESSKKKLDQATEKAPDKPSGLQKAKQGVRDFLWGAHYGILDIANFAEPFLTLDPKGAAMNLASVFDGAKYAVEHPTEFAKAAANWEEWSKNPQRAAGQLSPAVLLALATGGGSALRNAAQASRNAASRLRARKDVLNRGNNRDRAEGKGTHDQCGPEKTCDGEPVDVVTGEMTMSATDVRLPGNLPLVLDRTHVSGHTSGGWFGRTWAATLDQRLELDADGVVFVADDGMLLTYPIPHSGEDTLPDRGPRWPLRWNGEAGGSMTITIPEHGRNLHFAPLPDTPATELPLQTISDRNGHRIDISYDPAGTPTEISHTGGYRIAIDTDPEMLRITALRLLGVGDPESGTRLISYGYNAAGDLTDVVNSMGKPLRFTYDDEHRMTSWTDRNGTQFGYFYDSRGRVTHTVGSENMLSGRFHYDDTARTTTYTDSLGNQTQYVYNDKSKVVAQTDPLGNTTRTDWSPQPGRFPLAVTDPLGRTTRYVHDDHDRLTRVERPDGTAATALYNDLGLPVEVREPDGAVWRHTYDQLGNRTSTTDPTGAETRYVYDDCGNLSSITDALGHTTHITANAAGLPVEITDPLGNATKIRRGTHGRITRITDPLGHVTRHGWTVEGKPSWRIRPDGSRESWTWDPEGNLREHTDPAGNTTRHTYTHFDRPATRTEPDGAMYAFTYDTESRLTTVTNPQGLEWRYEYDAVGGLLSEMDFNGREVTYSRDAAGQLKSRTNGAGEAIYWERDALGRTTVQRTEDGGVTHFTYDAAGRLIQAVGTDTELGRDYDATGRVLREVCDGRTTTYTYDRAGNRTSRTTSTGLTSTWRYDAAGRPAKLTTAGNDLTFTYDAAGREMSRALGEAVTLTQTWDELTRLTSQTVARSPQAAGTLLQHREYAYRADDHLIQIRELTSGTRQFDLDPLGRVTAVNAHGWTETYAYDSAGNLTTSSTPAHPSAVPSEFTGTLIRRAGRTTYEHDAQGRLIRRTRRLLNGQRLMWTYQWNSEDRLTEATTPDGAVWRYTYDPLGRRTSKQRIASDGAVLERTDFTWDGTRLAEQTTLEDQTTSWDYMPRTHRPLTQTMRHTPAEVEPGESGILRAAHLSKAEEDARFHAIVTDLLGTPTELVTPTGDLAWQHRTALWGTPLFAPAHATDCPLRFPGQYADPETALNYNYFRYYDPETARYLTPDPLGLAPADNPHIYIPNPLAWIDPLGLQGCDPGIDDDTYGEIEAAYGHRVADGVDHDLQRISDGSSNALDHSISGIGSDPHELARYLSSFEGRTTHVDTKQGSRVAYDDSRRDAQGRGVLIVETPYRIHAFHYSEADFNSGRYSLQ
ncbi:putative T7SS-secreted protein [Streptomyces sp. HSW2009]|uniref:putative T7SS-secreted protein n=1 Tax=Streptomyces sp. HSW2009 TaxID=3142890 RepID=UPI0032EF1921